MNIGGKLFEPYISKTDLDSIVSRIASDINRDFHRGFVMCPVLTGSFMFAADLSRKIVIPHRVSFVKYKSYEGTKSTGIVTSQLPFTSQITEQDVLIVEDIVDSGLTIEKMLEDLQKFNPRSVKICTLLFKPKAFRGSYKVDYIGKEIDNEFVVGYGMDYNESSRNLHSVYKAV